MPRVAKSPAYQWYPRDYMSDALVVSMTLEQEGAYRRLMDVCWLEHGLPNDVDQLWRLAKATSRDRFTRFIWNVVGRKFQLRRGKLQHKRLDRERAKQSKTRKARKLAANKSWEQRRSKCNANASDLQCLTSSSSSASSTAVSTEKITGAARRQISTPVENRRVLKAIVWREVEASPDDEPSEILERIKVHASKSGIAYGASEREYLQTEFETALRRHAEVSA